MANALTEKKQSALAAMAERLSIEPAKLHKTLKQTVFKNASDEEMVALVVVANEHGLNPLCREIYAFPGRGGGIVPVISVDGWIRIMNSHPKFNGIHFHTNIDEKGAPVSIACTIWVKGRDNPTVITEFMSECKRNTEPWQQYPSPDAQVEGFGPGRSYSVWICRLCRWGGLSIKRRTERRCGEASGQ